MNLTAVQAPSRGSSWNVRFDPAQLVVSPGQSVTGTAVITAPTNAADGDANTITIRGRVGDTYYSDLVVVGRVNPEFRMELTANTTAVVTRPGQASTVRLTVQNLGNTPDVANLTTLILPESARLDWRVSLDYDTLEVRRGDSRAVTLTIRSTVRDPTPASVTVSMTTAGAGDRQSVTISLEQTTASEPRVGFTERIPGPGLAFVALALLGAALVAGRRRTVR